ncbi:MAG: hypothetical protein GX643_01360 [Acidimicrobiales bacterium]|nr:hypothetical protein [Acidimicrobiales bacterium]
MTEPDLLAWGRRLVPNLPTVARLYLPGSALDARRRELVAALVSGACRADVLAALHISWLEFLGPAELDDVDDELFRWAVAAVATGPDEDLPPLPDGLSEAAGQALAAAVAHGVVSAVAVHRAGAAVERVLGRRELTLPGLASDLVAAALAAPTVLPVAAAAGALAVVGRIVPEAAEVDVDPDPNLLTQLLADALPTWLGGAWARVLVATLPVEIPMSWRSGPTVATVRVGRGRVQVVNGLSEDAWALFDGDVDSLVRAGSHRITREVRTAHAGR